MAIKLAAGGLALVVLAVLLQGCLFGGGDDKTPLSAVARAGAIPTATPPATLPEPILLGQAQSAGPGASTTATANPGIYTVKSGDTLGAIASTNGIAPDQQAAWIVEVLRLNGIEDARLLKAGQELQLPRVPTQNPNARTTPGAGTPAPGGTPNRTTTPGTTGTPQRTNTPGGTPSSGATPTPTRAANSGGANTYTVQSGDTPIAIAVKLNVPSANQTEWANQLMTLNNANPSTLAIGQVLQLPPIPSGGAARSSTPALTATPR